ncbi:MAG: hypothetical protein JXR69_06155 [Candidatus Delongbacteria bacterium]|nr:hypothetical protein [Candidatus Delongbacteria bacterium]
MRDKEGSMNKSICLTTYVFGEKYQYYIPLLIYSLLKAYPDYHPVIFVHEEINTGTKKLLDNLRSELGNFVIIENYYGDYKIKNIQKGKSIRWIMDHEEILNFDYCYFIDIDMFYVNEEPGLLEQHIKHCEILGLPYSNLIRKRDFSPWNRNNIKQRFKSLKLSEAFKLGIKPSIESFKLSGLHFVKTKEYYKGLNEVIERYKGYVFSDKSFTHHPEGFSNECFLYDMINESGMGLPTIVEDYGPHLLDYRRSNQIGFRPHHGIHLGIFRDKAYLEMYKQTLLLDFYANYYNIYKELSEKDELLINILNDSPKFIKDHFVLLNDFYRENL